MRSRASSFVLAAFLLTTASPVAGAVPAVAYDDAVVALQNAGVIDRGSARVFDTLNRAESLKVLILNQDRLRGSVDTVKRSMPAVSLFPDVNQSAWYAPYVEVAFQNRLVKGYEDGRLRPENSLSVAEAATLLIRSYGAENIAQTFQASPDLPNTQGQWYSSALSSLLAQNGVMPSSRLRLSDAITRGEFFDMIARLRLAHGQSTSLAANPSVTPTPQSSNAPHSVVAVGTSAGSSAFASSKDFAISIPSINILDLTVHHPTDATTQKGILAVLKEGVGHLFGYPGSGGKVLIYGHSSGYPWDLSQYTKIFRGINKVNLGDRVYVTYKDKVYVYQVSEKRTVLAKDKAPYEPDDNGEELILYTCWPPDSITHRFLVFAKPVETVAAR